MQDADLGAVVRALRHRRGWRQADLARRAGVSATVVGAIERAQLEGVSLRAVRGVAQASGIRLGWDVGFRGPELARLRDADHATMSERTIRTFGRLGWHARAEVSFNEYGDRGRIDVFAWHAGTGVVAVVEVKTVIADVQETLGLLDVKRRVAPSVARAFGWKGLAAVPILVVAASTTNRRRIDQHAALFAELHLRGRPARAWLRSPHPLGGGLLLFVTVPNRGNGDLRKAGRMRVRPSGVVVSTDDAGQAGRGRLRRP